MICVAHPEAAGLIALAGLVVESPEGTLTARVEVVEQLAKPVDLLLVTVKAPALSEAIERVSPDAVAAGVVVPLLNGLEHMEVLRSRFDGRVAAGSISHFQAYRAGRVQVVEATASPVITIASETPRPAPRSSAPRTSCGGLGSTSGSGRTSGGCSGTSSRGSLRSRPRPRPPVAPSASCATTATWRPRLDSAIAETCAVADADGVQLHPAAQWAIIDEMADETTTSAARDVVAGRRSELDAIVGGVLRVAERLGVPCPTLTELAVAAGLR